MDIQVVRVMMVAKATLAHKATLVVKDTQDHKVI